MSSEYVGVQKKWDLTPVKECFSNREDELASKSEGKQAKSKSFLLPCPLMWAAPEGGAQI